MTSDSQKNDAWTHRRRRLAAALAVLCVAVLYVGITYTWFVGNQSVSTVAKIAKPSNLQILGPNSSAIEQLDLSYDASNVDGEKVTVRRGFCVESGGEAFELQVANTTNISGLTVKVYRVNVNGSNKDLVVDSSTTWSKGDEVTFTDISDETGSQTFDNYTNVQANAIPQYRYQDFSENDFKEGETFINFIIEVTWTESVKETDMVYLIAKNTSTATGN